MQRTQRVLPVLFQKLLHVSPVPTEINMPPPELNNTFVNEIPLTGFGFSPAADPETVRAVSRRRQAFIPLIFFPSGILVLGASLVGMGWLAFRGPSLVPLQDTRVTTIIISSGSRLSIVVIMAAFVRSAWALAIPHVLASKPLHTREGSVEHSCHSDSCKTLVLCPCRSEYMSCLPFAFR